MSPANDSPYPDLTASQACWRACCSSRPRLTFPGWIPIPHPPKPSLPLKATHTAKSPNQGLGPEGVPRRWRGLSPPTQTGSSKHSRAF